MCVILISHTRLKFNDGLAKSWYTKRSEFVMNALVSKEPGKAGQ